MSKTFWRHTLYVRDLHSETTAADLEAAFSVIGRLDSFGICKDAVSRRSLCYAFFNFFCVSHDMCPRTFKKKEERVMDAFKEQNFTNLYVKNFGYNMTKDLLREKFLRYGKVNNVVIMRDEEGNSRGFAFVNFDSDEEARKAVETLNG
nr:polyadenylate-binding protein 6-like [Ipomoea batatas]